MGLYDIGAYILYHFGICIGNDEPRGAWKILGGVGFGGGLVHTSALRADPIFAGNSDFVLMRCLLDKVRIYFEQNPDDEV